MTGWDQIPLGRVLPCWALAELADTKGATPLGAPRSAALDINTVFETLD